MPSVRSSSASSTPNTTSIYVDRNDDGTGTGNRYKKKSFNWYKQVIATNGETL
ncbi:MAG: hypothetical protein Q4Q08_06840 [Eubacteriales bacterium]|nr:hypothetical protein [Eubacteriales bacterium]